VRAATGGAKDLDPAHRRDGIGLLLLVAALITAGGAWWQAGAAGDAISDGLRWAFGKGALLLPVLCLLGAWRVLRHPESKGGRGRLAIGWACLGLGALGVLHVLAGRPADRSDAGGLTGFLLGEPLANLLTPWLAVPVLVLLAGFGVLVVTATPLHQVPQGLSLLRDKVLRREPPKSEGQDDDTTPVPLEPLIRNRPRRRQAVALQEDPEDVSPVVLDAPPPRRSRARAARRCTPTCRRTRPCPPRPSSSCSRATTSCRRPTCWPPAPRPRSAAPPTTRSSRRSARCSPTSRSTPASPASAAARRSPATRSSSARR
jgi:S-DNA-T family DNA segregation ATPase FtsK/SpoIIIE